MDQNPYKSPRSKTTPEKKPPSILKLIGIAVCFLLGLLIGYILVFVIPAVRP